MTVLKMASQEKRSPIWKFFSLCNSDDSKATCQVCNEKISRGGSKRKAYNMTNLRKHLQQHAGKYKELLEVEEREQSRKRSKEEEDKLLQPKIDDTLEALQSCEPAPCSYYKSCGAHDCYRFPTLFHCGGRRI